MPSDDAVQTPPVSLDILHARVEHLVIVTELTAQSVQRIEDRREEDREERRALTRLSCTLSHAALQLSVSKALSLVVPPTRMAAAVGAAAFLGGLLAQFAAVKLGMQPFAFAR